MKKFKEYITEITLSDVNKVAKKYEMKLNRGKGYYYFTGTNPSANIRLNKLYTTSVDVYKVGDISLDSWEKEMMELVKQMEG